MQYLLTQEEYEKLVSTKADRDKALADEVAKVRQQWANEVAHYLRTYPLFDSVSMCVDPQQELIGALKAVVGYAQEKLIPTYR
jgi:hypothetical protein